MTNEHGWSNTPNARGDFSRSHDYHERPLEYDAAKWEPTEEPEIEKPSEKLPEMHLRPGGALEEAVHTEIDEAARARILEAQRREHPGRELPDEKELDFAGDFDAARRNPIGWDPESRREYESWTKEQESHARDDEMFDTGWRFNREARRERGGREWER